MDYCKIEKKMFGLVGKKNIAAEILWWSRGKRLETLEPELVS